MKKTETHLFIIWQRGRYKEAEILEDMATHFTILKQYAITWTPELVSGNFTRFYGVNLPSNSSKEKECGIGEFLLCVVRDEHPVYEERMTSRGPETVNVNMFDSKTRYREWTGYGHKIHGTNSEKETNHDLTLLIGKNVKDFILENPDPSSVEALQRDIEGASGWKSLRHLFYVLNSTIAYVVLRNFESLPDKHDVSIHGDIDLLVDNRDNIRYITNAKVAYREQYRVYHHIKVGTRSIPFDFRYVGDNYYDKSWEQDILDTRVLHEKGFYVMDAQNLYYSLLYHAYIQKRVIASDYPEKLEHFAKAINVIYTNNPQESIRQLDTFMYKHGYEYLKPNDLTVGFEDNQLKLSHHYNRYGGACIKSRKESIHDVITKDTISWQSKVFRKGNSIVKAGTPWFIDNEVRFLQKIGDGVHYPRIIAIGGDEVEHWVEMSMLKGSNLFSNHWRIRIGDIRSCAIRILDLIEKLYDHSILHRDIAPNNILVDNSGTVALIDFAFAIDYRNDQDFLCPWNLGMGNAPNEMYSDFYNLAAIFENRYGTMPFVKRFAVALKKIDWAHYKDAEYVHRQVACARKALKRRYSIADMVEFALGKYRVRKYVKHPKKLLRRVFPSVRKPYDICVRICKKVIRKVRRLLGK